MDHSVEALWSEATQDKGAGEVEPPGPWQRQYKAGG
jgi:hypothetical protein